MVINLYDEYCFAIQRNEVLIYAIAWMNLKTICEVEEARPNGPILYHNIYMECL